MTISSYEIVFFTAVFLLPGFFMRSIVASLNPVKKSSDNAEFLYCLMYSIINLAVWSWSYALVTQIKETYCLADWVYWVIIVLITMIGATITAFLIGAIIQKRFVRWLGNKFNLNTIDPTDTAWDWLFAKRKCSQLLITLKDGSEVCGWYADDSFTSSDATDRDIHTIYLQKRQQLVLSTRPGEQGDIYPKGFN